MWDYWFEVIVLMCFASIFIRMWFVRREIKIIHNMLYELYSHVFMQTGDVQVNDGENYQVISLEEFIERFGFDPSEQDSENAEKADSATIQAWDEGKL